MVSRCANPECSLPLRYLRHGRIFQFEVRTTTLDMSSAADKGVRPNKSPRMVTHYWLCGHCCQDLTLVFDQIKGVRVVRLDSLPQPSVEIPAISESPSVSVPMAISPTQASTSLAHHA